MGQDGGGALGGGGLAASQSLHFYVTLGRAQRKRSARGQVINCDAIRWRAIVARLHHK